LRARTMIHPRADDERVFPHAMPAR
jgi:hypothetical protein